MENTDNKKALRQLIGSLKIGAKTHLLRMENDVEGIGCYRTTCNGLSLVQFEDELYDILETLDPKQIKLVYNKYFLDGAYQGVVHVSTDKITPFESHVFLVMDILDYKDLRTSEQPFIESMEAILKMESYSSDVELDSDTWDSKLKWKSSTSNLKKFLEGLEHYGFLDLPNDDENVLREYFESKDKPGLKWNKTTLELGYILSFLEEEDLVRVKSMGKSGFNKKTLATQILRSFQLNGITLQTVRKSLNRDKTKLASEDQKQLQNDLRLLIGSFNSIN